MGRGPSAERGAARLGVFGGTFDPPHNGHVSVAGDVARAMRFDRVLWMPAGDPPHKPDLGASSPETRLDMVQAAIEGHPTFEASRLEVDRPGPSFTVDTVRALADAHPDDELFVIVGVDQYESFGTWRDPDGILARATLVVMDRSGAAADAPEPPGEGAGVVRVPVARVDVSSTRIRERVRAGGDISSWVPGGVRRIIQERGLYRASDDA